MKRRDFIKKSLGAGVFTGSLLTMGSYGKIFADTTSNSAVDYDLIGIRGGEPVPMFDRAIESMGGMRKYVKPGQKVVVKPNIGWDVKPELAATTNPKLVARIIEQCYAAGAKKVYVFDHTCDEWRKSYQTSGIEKAAKDAGATVAPGHTESYYQHVDVPQGKVLKEAKEHELMLESDVFINVPILKDHGSARMTIAMKNLMGVIYDRSFWHRNGLHQCIADFASYRQPDLNIVDAYRVMTRNGPRGKTKSDVAIKKYMVLSDDIVAADAASAKVLNPNERVAHIEMGDKMGYGEADLSKLKINRIKI